MNDDPSNRRPTLADVARVAGVSMMTVSRVVRGTHVVREKTVARVQEAIARVGYRPDPALSALAAYRSNRSGSAQGNVLAFLDCDGTPYSQKVLGGAREEAAMLGYGLESFRLPVDAVARQRLGRMLFHRGVHGVLVGPSDVSWKFEGWNWAQFAAVSTSALLHEPAMHTVAMDYFQGAMDGCRALQGWGCRRVALAVQELLETRTGHRWLGGYGAWAEQVKQRPLYADPMVRPGELARWLREKRADAVLTIHGHVWRTARRLGIKVFYLNSFECPPGVPHLALDAGKIGEESVRVLHHLLLRREYGVPENPKRVALHATMVVPGRDVAG